MLSPAYLEITQLALVTDGEPVRVPVFLTVLETPSIKLSALTARGWVVEVKDQSAI